MLDAEHRREVLLAKTRLNGSQRLSRVRWAMPSLYCAIGPLLIGHAPNDSTNPWRPS